MRIFAILTAVLMLSVEAYSATSGGTGEITPNSLYVAPLLQSGTLHSSWVTGTTFFKNLATSATTLTINSNTGEMRMSGSLRFVTSTGGTSVSISPGSGNINTTGTLFSQYARIYELSAGNGYLTIDSFGYLNGRGASFGDGDEVRIRPGDGHINAPDLTIGSDEDPKLTIDGDGNVAANGSVTAQSFQITDGGDVIFSAQDGLVRAVFGLKVGAGDNDPFSTPAPVDFYLRHGSEAVTIHDVDDTAQIGGVMATIDAFGNMDSYGTATFGNFVSKYSNRAIPETSGTASKSVNWNGSMASGKQTSLVTVTGCQVGDQVLITGTSVWATGITSIGGVITVSGTVTIICTGTGTVVDTAHVLFVKTIAK